MSGMKVFRFLFDVTGIILITIIYRWSIYFIHEFGHFIVGKGLKYQCKIIIRYDSLFMPRLSTNIKGNVSITAKQNLFFSMNGVILAEIVNFVLLFFLINYKFLYMLVLVHIPVMFIDMIPDTNSDGKWILVEIKKIFSIKDTTMINHIPFIFYSILLVISTILTIICYIHYYNNDRFIWYGFPILFIFYFTSYRYIYRYFVNLRKGKGEDDED